MVDKADKLAAFKAYNFDGDEAFKAHLQRVELPAGSAAAAALQRVKAKFYAKNIDPDFDPSWLASPSAQSTAPDSSTTHSPQQQTGQQHSSRAAPMPSAGPPPRTGSAAAGQPYARQLYLAILQAMVLLFALLYLQPVKLSLSNWAYSKLTLLLLVSQGLKVHAAHGWPGFNLEALKVWARRVRCITDAQYFLLAFVAFINPPYTYVLVPFVVLAVYQLAYFLYEHHSSHPLWQQYGQQVHQWLVSKQQQALLFNAQSEIMCGFSLIFGLLFPTRRLVLMFAVWHILTMRYWSTDAAIHHRRVWQALDQLTARYRYQFPFLQKVVNFGIKFFEQARPLRG